MGEDGKFYTTANFERDIRMPDRTKAIAEDFWQILGKYDLRDKKSIVFCVDDTHAAFMAQEFRRLPGDNESSITTIIKWAKMDIFQAAIPLILKALRLSARRAGKDRFRGF